MLTVLIRYWIFNRTNYYNITTDPLRILFYSWSLIWKSTRGSHNKKKKIKNKVGMMVGYD